MLYARIRFTGTLLASFLNRDGQYWRADPATDTYEMTAYAYNDDAERLPTRQTIIRLREVAATFQGAADDLAKALNEPFPLPRGWSPRSDADQ